MNPPKMDSHWGMHSNLRPERCSFTHPLSSQCRQHSSQWDPRIKAPRSKNFGLRQIRGTNSVRVCPWYTLEDPILI